MGKEILIEIFFSLMKDRSRTRGHEVTLVKDQCRLDISMYPCLVESCSKMLNRNINVDNGSIGVDRDSATTCKNSSIVDYILVSP